MAWRDETFGEPDLDAPYPTRAQDKITVAFSRAVVMGAVQSVESGICAEDQDEPETWTACEFPQEWEPVAEYVANMPGELHEALQLQAVVCNPNAFYSGGDDPKKVMPGSVSVT